MATLSGQNNTDPSYRIPLPKVPGDRRKNRRIEFDAVLRAAIYDGQRFPSEHAFFSIETRDLASNGISFYCTDALNVDDRVVVELILNDAKTYVVARVLRSNKGYFRRKPQLLVACVLEGRING